MHKIKGKEDRHFRENEGHEELAEGRMRAGNGVNGVLMYEILKVSFKETFIFASIKILSDPQKNS